MERFKNYGLWISIAALIGLIVNDYGLLAPEEYQKYVDAVLAIFTAAGIVTNPSEGQGYADLDNKGGE